MLNLIYFLLFKLLTFIYQFALAIQGLFNGFIRFVYIPLFHSNLNTQKIIDDLSLLEKKPVEELTFVYEIRVSTVGQLTRVASKIIQNSKIIRQSVNPKRLNCYLEADVAQSDKIMQLKDIINQQLSQNSLALNIITLQDNRYDSVIKVEKYKATPLVVIYSSYPSVLGLHPEYLVGAEFVFKPNILKATQYDLYSAVQAYALSQQRKGK